MFTGLIEEIGSIGAISRRGGLIDIQVEAHVVLEDVRIGDSIAISGVCLTVTAFDRRSFTVQAGQETLRLTTAGNLRPGTRVNLERALKVGDRLGGHFVSGHVEAVGKIISVTDTGEQREIRIAVPDELDPYIVGKGSIAVDGISLTVTSAKPGEFGVAIIPHTMAATTLAENRAGDAVNIETDIFAKYVEKYARPKEGLNMETLRRLGYA